MPKLSSQPIPKRRYHGGRWRIYWKWHFKQYSIATPYFDPKKTVSVDADLRLISAALALDPPSFPDQYLNDPAVVAYVRDRSEGNEKAPTSDPGTWLVDYRHEISGRNTSGWIEESIAVLEKLKASGGGLEKIVEITAATYMADIAAKQTPGTHNRRLTVFKKFYAWLVNTRRHTLNPFAKIKRMNERKDTPIIYCTRNERDEAIVLAWATGWPEWPAVFIAFMTGMRREEIANLRWDDVRFESGTIFIRKTKTKTSRTIPMPTVLEEFLLAQPDKISYVVKVPEGENRVGRLNSLANRLKGDKKANLINDWGIIKPPPSKAKEFRKNWRAYEDAMAKRKKEMAEALGRLGWNVFRHTFASLKVQDGVSIEKVARWIGDDMTTALRHYAQFVPRDRRDVDIDKG